MGVSRRRRRFTLAASAGLGVFFVCAAAAAHSDWRALRKEIQQTLHVPDPLPKVGEKSYGHFTPAPGVGADRVSFATDYGMRVPAIVYHPAGATIAQHPALIVVNGAGGDKSSGYACRAGILYARAGALVLTYDPPGEYERSAERRSGTGQANEPLGNDELARRLAGLRVTDILQAARYLAGRTDVDKKRIAVVAFAEGSFIAELACAAATGPLSCVMATPQHEKPLFEELRAKTSQALASSKDVLDFSTMPESAARPYFLARPVALWLEEKLKFPGWTKKQLPGMAETRMENGMLALGNDAPKVPRDDLHALPEAVWEAEREDYVYETWLDRAKAAVRTNAP